MKEADFVKENRARWKAMDQRLEELEYPTAWSRWRRKKVKEAEAKRELKARQAIGAPNLPIKEEALEMPDWSAIPLQYHQLCADLAMAQRRMYSWALIEELNHLVIRAHRVLQAPKAAGWEMIVRFLVYQLPQTFRLEWRLFLACSLCFWLPFGFMIWASHYQFEWIEMVLGRDGMNSMDKMYGTHSSLESSRDFDEKFYMFAYYILNNVGIDFRTFAGGALAGVGSLIIMIFNGVFIGAAAGYCTVAADAEKFWYFVMGHSGPELTGMILCGMSGLRVGLAILAPGRLTRGAALGVSTKRALPILYGGILLTALAAPIEAFWSSMHLNAPLKLTFGVSLWVIIHLYFIFCGRKGAEA